MKFTFSITLYLLTFAVMLGQNPYYPLEKGQVQIFKYGDDFLSSPDQKAKIEILNDMKKIEGKEYFMNQSSLSTGGDYNIMQTVYVRDGNNGSIFGIIDLNNPTESVMFPERPWKVGTSWTSESMGMSSIGTIISLNGSIVTPEKTFTGCLVIEYQLGETKTLSYFQKDVGMVAVSMSIEGEDKLVQYLSK
jgi:hypothetical protein